MDKKEVYSNLCYYDERNPDRCIIEDEEELKCSGYCDNCFYGRHILALEIIKLNKW